MSSLHSLFDVTTSRDFGHSTTFSSLLVCSYSDLINHFHRCNHDSWQLGSGAYFFLDVSYKRLHFAPKVRNLVWRSNPFCKLCWPKAETFNPISSSTYFKRIKYSITVSNNPLMTSVFLKIRNFDVIEANLQIISKTTLTLSV